MTIIFDTSLAEPLGLLTQINLDDVVDAFGFRGRPLLARTLRALCQRPARKFAAQMLGFDARIAESGLAIAARELQRTHVRELDVSGRDRIPNTGPILALANHPSMTDTLCLFSALARSDLKVIALRRPFLELLPNLQRQLLFVDRDRRARRSAVLQLGRHLRLGGAALSFPAGTTEPDPDMYPGAIASLQRWSESVGMFLRLAPATVIVPVAVRSVVWRTAAHHPLTRLRRSQSDRELLACALQLLTELVFDFRPVSVRVRFGAPITAQRLGSCDPRAVHRAVLSEMTELLG